MLWSFLYPALCAALQLLALRLRSGERKELEILVLRHEAPQQRGVSACSGARGCLASLTSIAGCAAGI